MTTGTAQARQQVRVAQVEIVARDVVRVALVPAEAETLLAWEPGAHIDVEVPSGAVRQYSLCGEVDQSDRYEVAVLRRPDGVGSAEMHELRPGAELRVSRPRNDFVLRDSPRYLFVAGGIGITPLLPMIAAAEARDATWRLVYGGRSRDTMAFVDDLEATYGDRVRVVPEDDEGLLDLPTVLAPTPDTLVYCCGPDPMLAVVEAWCADHWPPDSLVLERFGRTSSGHDPAPPPAPETTAGEATTLQVQLGPGGPVLDVPADKSVLEVLIDAGVDIFYSCQEGICGSCETRVISGEPDHRDDLLTPQEQQAGAMLVCVSRGLSRRLVLDLEPPT